MTVNTSGWTRVPNLFKIGASGGSRNQDVWYKFGNGSESVVQIQNISAASKWFSGQITVWRGVALVADGGPFDVAPVSGHIVDDVSATDITCPAITTVTDAAVFLVSYMIVTDMDTETVPAGYTLRGSHISSTFLTNAVASKLIATAGAETPGAWAITPDIGGLGWSMVLKPAQS